MEIGSRKLLIFLNYTQGTSECMDYEHIANAGKVCLKHHANVKDWIEEFPLVGWDADVVP